MKTLAIDYETDWASDYTVKDMGAWAYVRDPRFHAHTVALYGEGLQFVGRPADAPWQRAVDEFPRWVSHHAAFDMEVHGQTHGAYWPVVWDCTADLMAYLQHPRPLAEACRVGLGVTVDKSMRERMKGLREGVADFFVTAGDIYAYALDDAKRCWQLWEKFSPRWPEHERELSRHTRRMAARGIGFDEVAAEKAIQSLGKKLASVEKRIPWVAAGKPPTSRTELLAEVARLGLPAPTTTAEKSEEWQAWLDAHEKDAPWVRALNQWRKLNRTRTVIAAMRLRSEEGRLHAPLRYYGAAVTGRWSGSDGLNLQNLNSRDAEGGVNIRALIKPAEGNVFIVSDLSQIEPRCLAVMCGDDALLAKLREGFGIYEAHARTTMMWEGGPLKSENPSYYALAKARCLGLSYGAGAETFVRVAKIMAGLSLSLEAAAVTVQEFRQTNPRIVEYWDRLGRALKASEKSVWAIKTASGRVLRYFSPADGECEVVKGSGKRVRYWGSKLCENLVQATARDVLASMVLEIEAAGLPVVLHVHDEIVCEVPRAQAEAALETVRRIMSTPPKWMPGLPVECEAHIMEEYGK